MERFSNARMLKLVGFNGVYDVSFDASNTNICRVASQ